MTAPHATSEVILFEHENFRGAHRHVFTEEKDLAFTARGSAATPKPERGKFDLITSSIIVRGRHWTFITEGDKRKTLKPGFYP